MTPEPSLKRKFSIDPAWLALILAALVLVLGIVWLFGRRAPPRVAQAPAAMSAQVATPAPAPAPVSPLASIPSGPDRVDALTERLAAMEAALGRLGQRPAGDPEALAALGRQITATREAGEQALHQRIAALETARDGRLSQRLTALEATLTTRISQANAAREAVEQALAARLATLDQTRVAGETSLGQRMTNLETSQLQRQSALETGTAQRLTAMEQAATQRLAPLEQALERLTAAEARTERLAAITALRALLDTGRPLGVALPRLGAVPPPALARFASVAPPTEPALRLSFEEALRQARGTAQEGVLPRLNALLTIRRGDDVVWGDATEAHVERARRALEAGDVEGALTYLARLPDATRQALRGWIDETQALAEARAALRSLAGG